MVHLSEINAQLTGVERKFLNLVLRGEHGPRVTEVLLSMAVPECAAFVKDQVARARAEREGSSDEHGVPGEESEVRPPATPHSEGDFMAHVLAGSAFLTAEERAAVMWLLPKFPADRVQELTAMLMQMSPRDAAMWIKEHLGDLRREVSP